MILKKTTPPPIKSHILALIGVSFSWVVIIQAVYQIIIQVPSSSLTSNILSASNKSMEKQNEKSKTESDDEESIYEDQSETARHGC